MKWRFAEITDEDRAHAARLLREDALWQSQEYPYYVVYEASPTEGAPKYTEVLRTLYQSAARGARRRILRAGKRCKLVKIASVMREEVVK